MFWLFFSLLNDFFHDAYAVILENMRQRKMKNKNVWYKWKFRVKLVSSSDLNAHREEILEEKLVLNMGNQIGFTELFTRPSPRISLGLSAVLTDGEPKRLCL